MPIRLKDCEKTFTWRNGPDELPIGEVRTFGGIPYVMTCPLCGCMHELKQSSGVINPRCLLREYAHQRRAVGQPAAWITIYERWCKLHPDAAAHTCIYGMSADEIALLEAPPKATKKRRGRKAKAA